MRIIFLGILCLYSSFILAQEQTLNFNNDPLEQAIKDIENLYQVRFSYNTETIKYKLVSISGQYELEKCIAILKQQTLLSFIKIDNDNYVIRLDADKNTINKVSYLDEVVVLSEYLTSGYDVNKKTGAIEVKPQKLSVLPGLLEPDVLQSLQFLPGITSPTESASRLHIRGGTPDQNLIVYDGITMYHDGHLFGIISPFNPFITEKIEVYRSGASAEYGKRIAGIIDIKSIGYIPEEISGSFGSNVLQADANIKMPIVKDKLGIVVAGRRALTDIWDSFTFQQYSDKVFQNTKIEEINNIEFEEDLSVLDNNFTFSDVFAKVLYAPHQDHLISLSSIFVTNDLNHRSQDLLLEGTSDQLNLTNKGFSLNYIGKLSPKWDIKSNLYFSNYNSEYQYQEFNTGDNNNFNTTNSIEDLSFTAQANYKPNQSQNISLGYDYSNYKVALNIQEVYEGDPFTENISTTQNRHTLFSQYAIEYNKWFLRAGLRANYFSDLNSFKLAPRLYLDYQLDKKWKLKFSGEQRYQIISQLVNFNLNDLGLGNELWALTNDEIKVLTNTQFTTGVLFNSKGWNIDVEGYYKYIDGLSSLTRGFNSSSVSNEDNFETGSNTIYGIDLLVKKRINRLSFWLGYTLSKSDFEFPDIQDGSFPGNFDQRHNLSISSTLTFKKLEFSLGGLFSTGRPYTSADGLTEFTNENGDQDFEIDYNSQNGSRLPNYWRIDSSVLYNFYFNPEKTLKGQLGASVINIFNRTNEIDRIFSLEDEGENPEIAQQTIIGLETTFNLMFRVNF